MNNFILYPSFTELLKDIQPIFNQFGIDYYLVGAVARDIHLGDFSSSRKTEDIDIAILIDTEDQFCELKDALVNSGNFKSHSSEAIKLLYKDAIEIDLLPFGEIELPNREIRLSKPKPFIINMPGFKEVFPYIEKIKISEDFSLNICCLEGIIILKLIAYNDKPQRTKDISDIEHIVTVYFDINDDNIYDEYYDIMDLYQTDKSDYLKLVSARVLGRKMKTLLEGSYLYEHVIQIIEKRSAIEIWQAMKDGMED